MSGDSQSHGRDHQALITGVGLVSSLGEGLDAHLARLDQFGSSGPVLDTTTFTPFLVHPMVTLELDRQIPKRGDQRQMEAWQRIGTYAAGQALEAAGIKGDTELLAGMDMIVAAGGGERDYAVDTAIMSGLPAADDPRLYLNEHLQSDLRPTLFLAQLSNLLAGNISIVHGVAGSSRTFMGEEASGTDAIRIACARIAAGQGDLFLVGGSFNAQRADTLLLYQLGGTLWTGGSVGVWARQSGGGGLILGSVGCFMVIESRAHADRRGATPLAHIAGVHTDRCRREPGQASTVAAAQVRALGAGSDPDATAIISGASGVAAPTREEAAFLRSLNLPVRATGTALGHSLEPSFPANIAIAAGAIARGRLFAPLDPAEAIMDRPLREAIVTSWGHWRGEALAVVTPA